MNGFVPGGAIDPVAEPLRWASGTGRVAALTFDDGPNGDDTARLLDFLAETGIRAVFCVVGECILAPGGAALLRRIVADGHLLGNHSTSFADLGEATEDDAAAAMRENLAIIRAALGDPGAAVPFFRAPNGSWGGTAAVAVGLGMQPLAVVNTIDDWRQTDTGVLVENLRAAIVPGELVLVHDGGGDRSPSIAAVRTVVGERLAEGWSFTLPGIRTP